MARNQLLPPGAQWRLIEGGYPTPTSPNCILVQFRKGTEWTTVAGFKPDGTDIRACAAIYEQTSAQTFTNAVSAIINYSSKILDTDLAVTTGTSWKFTCPNGKGGVYTVDASLQLTFPASTLIEYAYIEILKNGTRWTRGNRIGFTTGVNGNNEGIVCGSMVVLAAGDTLSIQASQNSGANRTSEASPNVNVVSISRLPITLP